jgi:hypothetical protein
LKKDPETFELIAKGKANISQAKKIISLPEEKRLEIYAGIKNGKLEGLEISKVIRSAMADLGIGKEKERPIKTGIRALDELEQWYDRWRLESFVGKNWLEPVFPEMDKLFEKVQETRRQRAMEHTISP